MTTVSGLNSVGEDKSTILKAYRDPLPIHLHLYEFPLGTNCSGYLSVAPSCGEEHDVRDTIRLHKDTMRKDAMEFIDPLLRVPAKQELKIAERVAAYNAGEIDKVTRIDKREEKRSK